MSDFERLFEAISGGAPRPPQPKPELPEKGVLWEAKIIDGAYYVPLRQVAELLETNGALPKVRRGIEARVQAQADRVKMRGEG